MSRKIFITGTGTDIGKTYVSGLIVKKIHDTGFRSAYYKAAMSGNVRAPDGSLIPGDAAFVKKMSQTPEPLPDMCPYVYEHAYSPHLASRIEGNPVQFDKVREGLARLELQGWDFITMEGSGGITCPLSFDSGELYLDEMVKKLGLTSIIVADAGLGTINYVVLTVNYMKDKGLPVAGIIYNHCHKGSAFEDDNIFMCTHLTGVPEIARVSDGDTSLDCDAAKLMELYRE